MSIQKNTSRRNTGIAIGVISFIIIAAVVISLFIYQKNNTEEMDVSVSEPLHVRFLADYNLLSQNPFPLIALDMAIDDINKNEGEKIVLDVEGSFDYSSAYKNYLKALEDNSVDAVISTNKQIMDPAKYETAKKPFFSLTSIPMLYYLSDYKYLHNFASYSFEVGSEIVENIEKLGGRNIAICHQDSDAIDLEIEGIQSGLSMNSDIQIVYSEKGSFSKKQALRFIQDCKKLGVDTIVVCFDAPADEIWFVQQIHEIDPKMNVVLNSIVPETLLPALYGETMGKVIFSSNYAVSEESEAFIEFKKKFWKKYNSITANGFTDFSKLENINLINEELIPLSYPADSFLDYVETNSQVDFNRYNAYVLKKGNVYKRNVKDFNPATIVIYYDVMKVISGANVGENITRETINDNLQSGVYSTIGYSDFSDMKMAMSTFFSSFENVGNKLRAR